MTVRLEELLAAATPPYRIAGIPPGIISANDYDVTEEALEALAHFPDAVRLLIDMGEELENLVLDIESFAEVAGTLVSALEPARALRARLDRLGAKDETA